MDVNSPIYTAVPSLIISVFVLLKVLPNLFFVENVARHVPSNRLIELESDESLDLCFPGSDLGFEGASVGDGFSSEIGAGSRCAEIKNAKALARIHVLGFILLCPDECCCVAAWIHSKQLIAIQGIDVTGSIAGNPRRLH